MLRLVGKVSELCEGVRYDDFATSASVWQEGQ